MMSQFTAPRPAPARRQRGAGLIGTLVLLVCIGFSAVVTIRSVPTYLEFRSVKAAVSEALTQSSPAMAREAFSRNAEVNGITSVKSSDLVINTSGDSNRFTVRAVWDKLVPLYGPAYLLIKYDTDAL